MNAEKLIQVPELGQSIDEIAANLQSGRVDGIVEDIARGRHLRALSVGQEALKPFGGRLRGDVKRPVAPKRDALSVGHVGGSGVACSNDIVNMLNSVGGQACMLWGADPPGGSIERCRATKKLCGAILPYQHDVPAAATAEAYELFAKKWAWPLFWVDSSDANITVADLTYTGDPVFENGEGSGPLDVTNLFPSNGYYGLVPGMPAIDSTNGLEFALANADGANPQPFQGMFIVVSVRN